LRYHDRKNAALSQLSFSWRKSVTCALNAIIIQKPAEPNPRIFDKALLGFVINVNQTKPRLIPFGPFKIIGEAPDKVAVHLYPSCFAFRT
jgi:hypothetical protein